MSAECLDTRGPIGGSVSTSVGGLGPRGDRSKIDPTLRDNLGTRSICLDTVLAYQASPHQRVIRGWRNARYTRFEPICS